MDEPITGVQLKEVIDCEGWPGYIRAMARELAERRGERAKIKAEALAAAANYHRQAGEVGTEGEDDDDRLYDAYRNKGYALMTFARELG